MSIIQHLSQRWNGKANPVLIKDKSRLFFDHIIQETNADWLEDIHAGDVVALIGDFDPAAIAALLLLIDAKAIVVPLTTATANQHEYFYEAAHVNVVLDPIHGMKRLQKPYPYSKELESLRGKGHAGLVLFSTGTTGKPKAILHDFTLFLQRFETPRPTLRTMSFLLFDHIGGINTLFHTLYNCGTIIVPLSRTVDVVLETCAKHEVEALPTTPTYLRLLLMSGAVPDMIPPTLKIITYGTEKMDQATLDTLCKLLPNVDFRQTFGMSELGIVRVKSEARDSLFMRIGGDGVETKVVDGVLWIKSPTRMIGYLNSPTPFDEDGWYNTNDVVEAKGDMYKIVGRTNDVINVGGLKFLSSDVADVAMKYKGVKLCKVQIKENPITGQHVELLVEPVDPYTFDRYAMLKYMKENLQPHMAPKRIAVGTIEIGHRFKQL